MNTTKKSHLTNHCWNMLVKNRLLMRNPYIINVTRVTNNTEKKERERHGKGLRNIGNEFVLVKRRREYFRFCSTKSKMIRGRQTLLYGWDALDERLLDVNVSYLLNETFLNISWNMGYIMTSKCSHYEWKTKREHTRTSLVSPLNFISYACVILPAAVFAHLT